MSLHQRRADLDNFTRYFFALILTATHTTHSNHPDDSAAAFNPRDGAEGIPSPVRLHRSLPPVVASLWLRWAIDPVEALKLLSIPIFLYILWELFQPHLDKILRPIFGHYIPSSSTSLANPFYPIFLLSHPAPTSTTDDPHYVKGYHDLLILGYNVVFFSLVRQVVTITVSRRVAKYFGIKRESKLDRFGEQGYAFVYFLIFGAWGFRIMSGLPTWWYRTESFWIDYPHSEMQPELKRYYLMQMAYWCQQLIVLVLGLEKPRKDFNVIVVHHLVTLWLIGGSYLMNLTLSGNAVFVSMDIPEVFFAFSKLAHYVGWNRVKVATFAIFVCSWTYFRHYLSLLILRSVWTEWDLIPKQSQAWSPADGIWLAPWVRYQIFAALALLQALNLYWYVLILRVLVRTVVTSQTEDVRSDDEDDQPPE
ncbi:TLC domain-containing protein [Mycena rebaudengoi]|nr:TLC domain-containing protein [Mycena rebaudengoi]